MALGFLLLSVPAAAQSRELVSLQVSGELVFPTEDYGVLDKSATLGWEAQARFTFGRFSVGAGYQRSTVFKSDASVGTSRRRSRWGSWSRAMCIGVFGNVAAPYLAARLGYGGLLIRSPSDLVRSTENSFIYGGGLGVIFQVAQRVGIDLGAQYFVADFTGARAARAISLHDSGCRLAFSRVLVCSALLVIVGCGWWRRIGGG